MEHCPVTGVIQEGGKVVAVKAGTGFVECVYFVNCAGFWARKVGQMSEPHVKVLNESHWIKISSYHSWFLGSFTPCGALLSAHQEDTKLGL